MRAHWAQASHLLGKSVLAEPFHARESALHQTGLHCWSETGSARIRLCISKLKKIKLAKAYFLKLEKKRQLQSSHCLPSKNSWCCQKMLPPHRKPVTASLDKLRSESHPAQHVIPQQLLGIHCERSFLPEDSHEKSIQVPHPNQCDPEHFLCRHQGHSCSWKHQLHPDWERTSSTGTQSQGATTLDWF